MSMIHRTLEPFSDFSGQITMNRWRLGCRNESCNLANLEEFVFRSKDWVSANTVSLLGTEFYVKQSTMIVLAHAF